MIFTTICPDHPLLDTNPWGKTRASLHTSICYVKDRDRPWLPSFWPLQVARDSLYAPALTLICTVRGDIWGPRVFTYPTHQDELQTPITFLASSTWTRGPYFSHSWMHRSPWRAFHQSTMASVAFTYPDRTYFHPTL